MAEFYPISKLENGASYPRTRVPLTSSKLMDYTVSYSDVNTIPGFAFTIIARNVYGDDRAHIVIKDANISIREQDLKPGDKIKVPFDGIAILDSGKRAQFKLKTVETFSGQEG